MHTYQDVETPFGKRQIVRSDGAIVPADPANMDYRAFQEWLAAGNAVAVVNRALDEVKADLRRKVDEIAEQRRLAHLTGGSTKAMEYLEARDQALAVIAMGEAAANALAHDGADEFPVLAASVPIEAPSLYQAAVLIRGRYEAYATAAGAIKRTAIAAKKSISDASDAAGARAAYEAIRWAA